MHQHRGCKPGYCPKREKGFGGTLVVKPDSLGRKRGEEVGLTVLASKFCQPPAPASGLQDLLSTLLGYFPTLNLSEMTNLL